MCPDIGRVAEKTATFWPRSGHSPAELDGRLDDRRARWSDPGQGTQLSFGTLGQGPQIARAGEQIMSNFHDILPLAA